MVGMGKVYNDGRHTISDKMINNLTETAYNQDDFGMNKYGKPLHSSMNYDWLKMATEELVDLGKYIECEAERKRVVIGILSTATFIKDWQLVEYALHQLRKDGTGK